MARLAYFRLYKLKLSHFRGPVTEIKAKKIFFHPFLKISHEPLEAEHSKRFTWSEIRTQTETNWDFLLAWRTFSPRSDVFNLFRCASQLAQWHNYACVERKRNFPRKSTRFCRYHMHVFGKMLSVFPATALFLWSEMKPRGKWKLFEFDRRLAVR